MESKTLHDSKVAAEAAEVLADRVAWVDAKDQVDAEGA